MSTSRTSNYQWLLPADPMLVNYIPTHLSKEPGITLSIRFEKVMKLFQRLPYTPSQKADIAELTSYMSFSQFRCL